MNAENEIISMCEEALGSAPTCVSPISGSGSGRKYFRVSTPAGNAIATIGTSAAENERFFALAEILAGLGANAPRVLAKHDGDFPAQFYLQTDLGQQAVADLLGTPAEAEAVRATMHELALIHQLRPDDPRISALRLPRFADTIGFDLNYFKYCFLKPSGVEFNEYALEEDFRRLAADVASAEDCGVVLRDCQSRNVIAGKRPGWIDFQGALVGPRLYDVASFLWQAKAGFAPDFRKEMTAAYLDARRRLAADGIGDAPSPDAETDLQLMALVRTLQVLGAYGFRGLVEHKAHFLSSIYAALGNLRNLIESGALKRYPTLEAASRALIDAPRFRRPAPFDGLTVEVFSFSYKLGYPTDLSGNGGGFMFDCRALHNPGRYDEYKPLTGLDAPVREFLESRAEVQPFLEAAWRLTDPACERYISRGFTNLQVGFGCTGGRHRSVYCAEATGRHIAERFPGVRVIIRHREQDITTILSPADSAV